LCFFCIESWWIRFCIFGKIRSVGASDAAAGDGSAIYKSDYFQAAVQNKGESWQEDE
jgi:hypothetical protein